MGEPLKVGTKANRYPRIHNKNKYDKCLDEAGVGSQHKDGLSSQRGRTTIKWDKNGNRTVVREQDKVLKPKQLNMSVRSGVSLYDLLKRNDKIEKA